MLSPAAKGCYCFGGIVEGVASNSAFRLALSSSTAARTSVPWGDAARALCQDLVGSPAFVRDCT
jgi:hypothetical protein